VADNVFRYENEVLDPNENLPNYTYYHREMANQQRTWRLGKEQWIINPFRPTRIVRFRQRIQESTPTQLTRVSPEPGPESESSSSSRHLEETHNMSPDEIRQMHN